MNKRIVVDDCYVLEKERQQQQQQKHENTDTQKSIFEDYLGREQQRSRGLCTASRALAAAALLQSGRVPPCWSPAITQISRGWIKGSTFDGQSLSGEAHRSPEVTFRTALPAPRLVGSSSAFPTGSRARPWFAGCGFMDPLAQIVFVCCYGTEETRNTLSASGWNSWPFMLRWLRANGDRGAMFHCCKSGRPPTRFWSNATIFGSLRGQKKSG